MRSGVLEHIKLEASTGGGTVCDADVDSLCEFTLIDGQQAPCPTSLGELETPDHRLILGQAAHCGRSTHWIMGKMRVHIAYKSYWSLGKESRKIRVRIPAAGIVRGKRESE
jgi:hypothetical protein